MAKYQTHIVERPKFKRHQHIAKAISSTEHIYQHVEHQKKLIFGGSKMINTNPNPNPLKKANKYNFFGT